MERERTIKEYLDKIEKGEMKPYELEKQIDSNLATEIRRRYIEDKTGIKLENVGKWTLDFNKIINKNAENTIGIVQIPIGYIMIKVDGDYAKGDFPVFLATTEGKLIAGINRGASALNNSFGVKTKIIKSGMTRSIILEFNSLDDMQKIIDYINSDEGFSFLKEKFKESSKRLNLKDIEIYTDGHYLFIRYTAETAAAMGMNMITIASNYATNKLIDKLKEKGIEVEFISESGNLCADKKPSAINLIEGRGISIVASAVVKKDILEKYFKANAKEIEKLNYAKNYIGSSIAGSLAHNAHIANVLSAIFIAYGQDVAQIVDSSIGIDDVRAIDNGDLFISVYLPSLEIGTYGGGTSIETAKELLKATGVYGEGDELGITKYKFAEIIASAVLAGELNLLAAEASKELASSHASLKRY